MSELSPKNLSDYEKQLGSLDEKNESKDIEVVSEDNDSNFGVLESERDIATHVVSLHDDPTLNCWTIRAFLIGLGLSTFGGVLGTLHALFPSHRYSQIVWFSGDLLFQTGVLDLIQCLHVPVLTSFKQTVSVSTMFLAIISYVLGIAWENLIPSRGIFRWLNPVGPLQTAVLQILMIYHYLAPIQQEGKCAHCHYVQCSCELRPGN